MMVKTKAATIAVAGMLLHPSRHRKTVTATARKAPTYAFALLKIRKQAKIMMLGKMSAVDTLGFKEPIGKFQGLKLPP